MLSFSNILSALGLFILTVQGSLDGDSNQLHRNGTTILDPVCTANVTVTDVTTILSSTFVSVTEYVDTTVFHYVNVTINSTETNTETSTVVVCVTESTTSTLHFTVSNTETDLATITNTETATATVPATVTTWTTETIFSTTFDPCPKTCSVSAGTVSLFYWPTDRPYTYPSTYYDDRLDYTFKSPSVYMLIPTIVGTNALGTMGPSTTDWILELDLDEVSTIADGVDGSLTQQLTLSHLGTDCPQSADPTAIATMSDPRCAPILAAPDQVSTWASPCNACGRFGLFDPPYAIPTVTGGLVPTTAEEEQPTETTEAPDPTSEEPPPPEEEPEGVVLVVSHVDGTPVGTSTMTVPGVSGTQTSSVDILVVTSSEVASTPDTPSSTPPPAPPEVSSPSTSPPVVSLPSTTLPVVTAPATRVLSGGCWLALTALTAVLLI